MYVWKVTLKAKDFYDNRIEIKYLGMASKAKVAINQTLRLAKKEPWINKKITCVECLGELDFSTN